MSEFDQLLDLVENDLFMHRDDIDYASGAFADGRKFVRVFHYDDADEAGSYFEASEAVSGEDAIDTNYIFTAHSALKDAEAYEVCDIIESWCDGDDIFLDCPSSGFVYDGYDYSSRGDGGADWTWTDDVVEIQDCVGEFSQDQIDELYYEAGKTIVKSNGYDYYDIEEGDDDALSEAAWEEASNIINLWRIRTDSRLYDYLQRWYDYKGKNLEDNVRDCFYAYGCLFFVTGTGYSLFSDDLLGGSSDGRARKEFDDFVKNN